MVFLVWSFEPLYKLKSYAKKHIVPKLNRFKYFFDSGASICARLDVHARKLARRHYQSALLSRREVPRGAERRDEEDL